MKIELFTEKDLLCLEDLRPIDWNDLTVPFRFYLSKAFCLPKKYLNEDRIIGIGARIWHRNTSWLAHIIVHKDFRNQGVGTLIVKDLMESRGWVKNSENHTVSLIATDLGFPVYQSMGFEIQTEYLFYSCQPSKNQGQPKSKNIIPFNHTMLSSALKLDKETSGEDRGDILKDKLPGSLIYLHENEVLGFIVPDLGEGLVVAKDGRAGIELLNLKIGTTERIVLPRENITGREFLIENGFREIMTAKRMVYGLPFEWKPENLFSRIGGYLG